MPTITYTEKLETTRCWCGIALAVPSNLLLHALNDGQTIYCPLGHTFGWHETEADRLKKKLEDEERLVARLTSALDQERASHSATKASHSATKGQLTKTRKRVANGVCPCCHRSFVQLERHMKTKHPGFGTDGEHSGD